jgi:hypothetical protein
MLLASARSQANFEVEIYDDRFEIVDLSKNKPTRCVLPFIGCVDGYVCDAYYELKTAVRERCALIIKERDDRLVVAGALNKLSPEEQVLLKGYFK